MELIICILLVLVMACFVCKHFLFWFLEIYQRANLPLILETTGSASSNRNVPAGVQYSPPQQQAGGDVRRDRPVARGIGKRRRIISSGGVGVGNMSSAGPSFLTFPNLTPNLQAQQSNSMQGADDHGHQQAAAGAPFVFSAASGSHGEGIAEITQNGSVQQGVAAGNGDLHHSQQQEQVGADATVRGPGGKGPLVSVESASPNPGDRRGLPAREPRYDVFISHRGPDVKTTFAESVYEILKLTGVEAFLDQEELHIGETVSQVIVDTIKHASVQLAIFSKGYAESSWCLDELCLMVDSGAKLIPVFYDVQPSDLRFPEKGAYKEAFLKHEEKQRYGLETIIRWKNALNKASLLSGCVLDGFKGHQGKFLKSVVQDVLKEVGNVAFEVAKFPVGLTERVKKVQELLQVDEEEKNDVCMLGIVGMGGLGKTTLAKAVFNDIRKKFKAASFLFDVREIIEKNGSHFLQSKLLKDLIGLDRKIASAAEGREVLRKHLSGVHACIVLDNVDHGGQLKDLLVPEDLHPASVILATSRDKGLLEGAGFVAYDMSGLNERHSEELFCWHAFLKPQPPDDFGDLVEKFLKICDGLPLSLEVFGGLLYGRTDTYYWDKTWEKVSKLLTKDIKDRLKISYDGLEENQKEIFVDVACFFVGEDRDTAIRVWDGSGWDGWLSVEILSQKSLMKVDDDNRLQMHDHLRDIGRAIVNDESKQPGLRSRLWHPADVRKVLEKNAGTEKVQGLSLVTEESVVWGQGESGVPCGWPATSITQMTELRLLILQDACVEGDLSNLSKELLWLSWRNCPYNLIPPNFPVTNLRVLGFSFGELTRLWSDIQLPLNLRELDLRDCRSLTEIPKSIGKLRELQKVVLNDCAFLRMLPEDFCDLKALEHLELAFCKNLESLPNRLGHLRNLQHLDLTSCQKLQVLPESFGRLSKLRFLSFQGCNSLEIQINDSLAKFCTLESLNFSLCFNLQVLPRHITSQKRLKRLYLQSVVLETLPDDFGELSGLQFLFLPSSLRSLPPSFGRLGHLAELHVAFSPELEVLPKSFGELEHLSILDIHTCGLKSLEVLGNVSNLKHLTVVACEKLKELGSCLAKLSKLENLSLSGNPSLRFDPNDFEGLTCTTSLKLTDCPGVSDECIDSICTNMHSLITFHMHNLQISELRISKECLGSLEDLTCTSCKKLQRVEINSKTTLRKVDLSWCWSLQSVHGLEESTRLWYLSLTDCKELVDMPDLSCLKRLKNFRTQGCTKLKNEGEQTENPPAASQFP